MTEHQRKERDFYDRPGTVGRADNRNRNRTGSRVRDRYQEIDRDRTPGRDRDQNRNRDRYKYRNQNDWRRRHRRRLRRIRNGLFILLLFAAATVVGFYLLNRHFHFLADYKYDNSDFGIETYRSSSDADKDGIDDQTDILRNARAYLSTRPQYKSEIYDAGYPDDNNGVCTDVVGIAMRDAGYDLRTLVYGDMTADPDAYGIANPEINIDFRRVPNLNVYFKRHAISLTIDVTDISQWQGGDIVVYAHHIGVISDKRDKDGVPYVLHHSGEKQIIFEQDILRDGSVILAHYRIS